MWESVKCGHSIRAAVAGQPHGACECGRVRHWCCFTLVCRAGYRWQGVTPPTQGGCTITLGSAGQGGHAMPPPPPDICLARCIAPSTDVFSSTPHPLMPLRHPRPPAPPGDGTGHHPVGRYLDWQQQRLPQSVGLPGRQRRSVGGGSSAVRATSGCGPTRMAMQVSGGGQ